MRNKRIGVGYDVTAMILLGSIILGCFLPWVTIRSELLGITIETGFDSEIGMIYLILAMICLVLIPAAGQSVVKKVIIVGFGVVFFFMSIMITYNLYGSVRPYGTYIGYGKILEVRIEIGLYLELLSSFGLIIVGATVPTKGLSKVVIPDELKREPVFSKSSNIRYCQKCGKEAFSGDKFCHFCGAVLE